MASKKIFGYLVAVFALAVLFAANTSAFAEISEVEIKGINLPVSGGVVQQGASISGLSGEAIPVRVFFEASENSRDVRVRAWISGFRENEFVSERFVVLNGTGYSRLFTIQVPKDLDEISEPLELNVIVESDDKGIADRVVATVKMTIQRESYRLEILDVDLENEINAGEMLTLDVVLKNLGFEFADDTFVRARIEALGIEDRAFFGDLSFEDEPFDDDPFSEEKIDRLSKEDARERRLFLKIPRDAMPGVYVVEIEAFNKDSISRVVRKVSISGSEGTTTVVAPVHSKSFSVGEEVEYSFTIVNSGNRVQVFELITESDPELGVELSDPVIALPAGSSKTIRARVRAQEEGNFDFSVNVHSGAQLIKSESFSANVGDRTARTGGDTTVLLTVILAIVFVVLLVVLIVLLTRKPEKQEEFGESYY